MATSTIGSTGSYATLALWIDAIDGLGALSAPEIGELQNEEHNAGSVLMTGGTISASATNQIILRVVTGAKFAGNPLRYTDGARVLFDGTNEYFHVNWDHVVLQDFAISGTGGSLSSSLGRLWVGNSITATLQNLVLQENSSTYNLDDRGATAGVRENILAIRTGGTGTIGIRCANFDKTYLNSGVIAVGGGTTSTAFDKAYATPTYINCYAYGYSTDFNATYGASSKNCATDKTSGSSNIASMTGAQFSVASGDFVSVTNGTHDLRVASGSTKLKDLGAASGGTTTDILGNAISGGTRDIGAHEYQAAAASGAFPFKIKSVEGGGMQNLGGMTKR